MIVSLLSVDDQHSTVLPAGLSTLMPDDLAACAMSSSTAAGWMLPTNTPAETSVSHLEHNPLPPCFETGTIATTINRGTAPPGTSACSRSHPAYSGSGKPRRESIAVRGDLTGDHRLVGSRSFCEAPSEQRLERLQIRHPWAHSALALYDLVETTGEHVVVVAR